MRPFRRLFTFVLALGLAAPASAYLFWTRPAWQGGTVNGDEPGITVALPGATPVEVHANLLWSLRAGLNVAALQCQFAPALRTVANYNELLHEHAGELQTAYATLGRYFKRTGGKKWQTLLDQYTTRTYNGFATLHAQLGFCDTAASIGREAVATPRGKLLLTAERRMREFRSSLVPIGDAGLALYPADTPLAPMPDLPPVCYDKKGREKRCKPGRG